MNRCLIADLILSRLNEDLERVQASYKKSCDGIPFFIVDSLLPEDLARKLSGSFPKSNNMVHNRSLREDKYIAAQMNRYDTIIEEAIFAFQDARVVETIASIVGKHDLVPDSELYAGGISLMKKGQFLNPHLDNSHDRGRSKWRAFNLLFYVNQDWRVENGGNLELWPNGLDNDALTIESKFNRLVVMATTEKSWHSVSPITVEAERKCVSNYYFSAEPLDPLDKFHVTTFRGRPEQKIRNVLLKFDSYLRNGLRRVAKLGVKRTSHYYKR